MKFGVIYSIDWDIDEWSDESVPFEQGDIPEGMLDLFEMTEHPTYLSDSSDDDETYLHAKYMSKELLTRTQFEQFLRYTQLVATGTPTMGAMIGGAWGLGWTVPAVAFEGCNRVYDESAYVVPVPDVPPRKFDLDDPRGRDYMWKLWAEYQGRCFDRIEKAMISLYYDVL